MSENASTESFRTPSKQRPRKRSFHDPESEDSFDAPVEFVNTGPQDSKKTKFEHSRNSTPLKESSLVNTKQKRSPKIILPKEDDISSENNVVSDWDDTPESTPVKAKQILDAKNSILSRSISKNVEEKNLYTTCRKEISDKEEIQNNRQPLQKNYLDYLLCTQEAKNDYENMAHLSREQISLQVKQQLRCETEAFRIVCKDTNDEEVVVYLQDHWEEVLVDPGMEIRLIDAEKWGEKDYIVSKEKGLLIVRPDLLLTSTAVSTSNWCLRKIVLNERYKGIETANKAMLIGCIMHELFQIAIKHPAPKSISKEWILEKWRKSISPSVMASFVALKFSPKAFETELIPYTEVIISWVKTYMIDSKVKLPSGANLLGVHDIEENIWDPILGLKGKIDTTLKVQKDNLEILEALELKTGKSNISMSHSCQVLLYSLMLSNRYKQPLHPGSLLYLKDGTTRTVEPKLTEIFGIIQQRNNLAYYLSQSNHLVLPEPRDDPKFCENCEQALTCTLYEIRNPIGTPKFGIFAEKMLVHLDQSEREYFNKWSDGIYNEFLSEKSSKQKQSDLWKIRPEEREQRGTAIAGIKLKAINKTKKNEVVLRFERDIPFSANIVQPGSVCTISFKDKFGIAFVAVIESSSHHIEATCERKFFFLKEGNSYDLDVSSNFSSFANTLGNLLILMCNDPISSHLRSLIIDLKEPNFSKPEKTNLTKGVREIISSVNLTVGQKLSIEKSLLANDYCLIEGLPGAGKTTTISVLIQCIISLGKSVLLTSYTNSAVDTVITKLLKTVPAHKILRLGRKSTNTNIASLSLDKKLEDTNEKVLSTNPSAHLFLKTRKILNETPVVACTCYHSGREILLSWRRFDFCIVDEASMILEPAVLPALYVAEKFIMVGDTKQLAPLVLSKQSKADKLNISLFERLQIHKNAVVSLTEQFRMNRVIANLSSQLFYEGRLVCANKTVAESTLASLYEPKKEGIIFSTDIEDSCVWVDVVSDENNFQNQSSTINNKEKEIIQKICEQFCKDGVNPEKIGIMCTYSAQVENLRLDNKIEVNTIDQYQGRDKNIIIWSLVWNSQSQKKCELLHDERRVNVALTRAKEKLIIVGCKKSMEQIPIMSKIIPLGKTVTYSM